MPVEIQNARCILACMDRLEPVTDPAPYGPTPARPMVLVAEDDNITRMAVVALLHEAGFDTLEAATGYRALRALEETPGIRVLLTDIDMPLGIDGITLAACVHRRWPRVGIVMTSGKVAPAPGDVPAGAAFFPKPYAETELLLAVREQMARRPVR
jgi:two-component system, response regulator PdtaR